MSSMIAMKFLFCYGLGVKASKLHHQIARSFGGVLLALLCTTAVAHHDAQHLRQQELRSTVRQQMGNPVPVHQGVPASAIQFNQAQSAAQARIATEADANARHLSAQQRVELRRQLTRDLQAQRNPSSSTDR